MNPLMSSKVVHTIGTYKDSANMFVHTIIIVGINTHLFPPNIILIYALLMFKIRQ